MARIYLSSTYQDLVEHRESVYRVLRQLGHDVISMEDYTASGRPPLGKCLADVRGCDVYVGLFAWRYGFVVPEEKKAITELEYREARDNDKETLIFLLDKNAPWSPAHVDENRGAITALRKELGTDNVIQFFTSPEDLARCVSVAMANFRPEPPGPEPVPPPHPSDRKFYLDSLSRLTGELDSQIKFYRTTCAVLIGVALAVAAAGVVLGALFVGLGGLLVGTVTVFPTNTMLQTRRKKALLEGYEQGLRQDPPASDAVRTVRAFLDRQLKGEAFA